VTDTTTNQSKQDVSYQDVWKTGDENITHEVQSFWENNNLRFPTEILAERVCQLVFVARAESGEVIGVCTSEKILIETLDNHFYTFRCFVAPAYRQLFIARKFMDLTCEKFDTLSQNGVLDGCIGVVVISESQIIKSHLNKAIWPRTKAVFVGRNSSGFPMHVCYFTDACI
jgi:hypothetical protein